MNELEEGKVLNNQEIFEVQRIIQRGRANNQTYYLVQWKGYSQDQASWEPLSNLHSCKQAIAEFQRIIDQTNTNLTKKNENSEKQSKKSIAASKKSTDKDQKKSSKKKKLQQNEKPKKESKKESTKAKGKNFEENLDKLRSTERLSENLKSEHDSRNIEQLSTNFNVPIEKDVSEQKQQIQNVKKVDKRKQVNESNEKMISTNDEVSRQLAEKKQSITEQRQIDQGFSEQQQLQQQQSMYQQLYGKSKKADVKQEQNLTKNVVKDAVKEMKSKQSSHQNRSNIKKVYNEDVSNSDQSEEEEELKRKAKTSVAPRAGKKKIKPNEESSVLEKKKSTNQESPQAKKQNLEAKQAIKIKPKQGSSQEVKIIQTQESSQLIIKNEQIIEKKSDFSLNKKLQSVPKKDADIKTVDQMKSERNQANIKLQNVAQPNVKLQTVFYKQEQNFNQIQKQTIENPQDNQQILQRFKLCEEYLNQSKEQLVFYLTQRRKHTVFKPNLHNKFAEISEGRNLESLTGLKMPSSQQLSIINSSCNVSGYEIMLLIKSSQTVWLSILQNSKQCVLVQVALLQETIWRQLFRRFITRKEDLSLVKRQYV